MIEPVHDAVAEQYKDASNLNARIALHRLFSTNRYGWPRWVFDQLNLPDQAEILELGCGPANLWHENLARVPRGWQITLTDFSPGMIKTAQDRLREAAHPFRFQVVDAQSIPFEDERFDAVIANHMLYHVPDKPKAFSEMRRVLKPGGRLYATTVGHGHMRELDELVARFVPDSDPWQGTAANSFLLENGGAQLEEWFSQVDLYRYEDGLVVTEAEPLIAYALSSALKAALVGDRRAEFARFVEAELSRHGTIHIAKDSGIFVACRPRDA